MQIFFSLTAPFILLLNPPITARSLQIIPIAAYLNGTQIGTTLSLKGCADYISYQSIYKSYFAVGSYNVTVLASNLVSTSVFSQLFNIRYFWCSYPNVDIHTMQSCINGINCDSTYPNILTNYRSVPLVLNSIVTYNCQATQRANYNWSFTYYNASSQQWSNFTETLRQWYILTYGNDSGFWSNFNTYNLRNIIVPNHTMPYGLYSACLNVSMLVPSINSSTGIQVIDLLNFIAGICKDIQIGNKNACSCLILKSMFCKLGTSK